MQWTLDARPESAAVARALVRRQVASFGKEVEHTAVLLTDELVANAVLHGQGPIRLGVSVAGCVVRVSVSDAGTSRIVMDPDPDRTKTSGRGLFLVDSLSSKWGMNPDDPGKRVWFELEQPSRVV